MLHRAFVRFAVCGGRPTMAVMSRTAEQLAHAIAALDAQRVVLGAEVVDVALAALRSELAALQGAAPAQQLRLVSVLFLDVVGSTALSRTLDPEDIQAVMDGALAAFTHVVDQQGGKVMQYAGDSVLAAFGVEEAHEDDAERAVLAGLALLRQADVQAARVLAQHGHDGFGVRVGISSGGVLIGGGVDGEHSIRGITVNVAARMEQTAPPGGLRISHDTWRLVRGLFEVDEQPPLMIKGRDEPMLTYLVRGVVASPASAARRGVDGVRVPLLGRQAELAALQAAYVQACAATSGLVVYTVVAEAGLGKTRLYEEFGHWLAAQATGATRLEVQATERRRGRPYGVMRELFMAQIGVTEVSGAPVAREAWLAATAPLLGHRSSAAVLGHLLGLDFADEPEVHALRADARALRDRAFFHAVQLLAHAAATAAPLLLVLDDVHWADEGSLEFIDHLTSRHGELPLLLIALTRPALLERRPGWLSHQRIELQPLSSDVSQSLAQALLQHLPEVPVALTQLVATGGEGNPYFMEELVNMLIDQGAISVQGAQWTLKPQQLVSVQLPATLSGVLQARLDALPADRRRALQLAAVAGPVFWDQSLQVLDLLAVAALGELARRELIRQHEISLLQDAKEYEFRHHSLQRVAYASVLKRVKRAAHATLAQWMASLPDAAALQDQIAEHHERGGQPELARDAWQRAADSARSRFANAEALAHAERALALTDAADVPRRLTLLLLRVRVQETLADRSASQATLLQMQALADELGDAGWCCEVAARRANFYFHSGDAEQCLAFAERAVALVPEGDFERAANAHGQVFSALRRLGRHAQSDAAATTALHFARLCAYPGYEARTLNELGIVAFGRGDIDAATGHWHAALAIHQREGHLVNQGGTLCNLAFVAMGVGDFETAQQQFEQARELSERVGKQQNQGVIDINLGIVAINLGQPDAAHASALRALALLRASGDRWAEAAALRVLGQAELGLGRPAQAREHCIASRDLFVQQKMPHLALEAEAVLVEEALARHDVAAAQQQADAMLVRLGEGVGIEGADEPMRVLLAVWRGLRAASDARAPAALARARDELALRAARLVDPLQRERFLHAVPVHRAIVEGAAASC
jgi:class 3 adenylate cyclase/tetratricopeptide (TPR) repeat protein